MKKLLIAITILSAFSLIGCKDKLDSLKDLLPTSSSSDTDDTIPTLAPVDESTTDNYIYPYTGEIASTDPTTLTPYMMIVENSKDARPQSGLSEADIIYETSAEGGIPRFFALFHKNSPDKIGPVRSVRPYFLTLAKEHALPFGHCGGSGAAMGEIKSDSSLMSVNEMTASKNFFRDTTRKAPHNLYTSSLGFINSLDLKEFNAPAEEFFKYENTPFKDISENANKIEVVTNRVYKTDYIYENGKYTKYMDGELAKDANTDKAMTFNNVIVQQTDISLNTDGSHLDINLIGDGKGFLFTNGKKVAITWSKMSEYSPTKFYDIHGDEVKLSPGNTIINIIDTDAAVETSEM